MRTEISDIFFNIETEYDVSLTDISREKYCKKIEVKVNFSEKTRPDPIFIRWSMPGKGIYTCWNPLETQDRTIYANWSMRKTESRSASSMPIQCYMGNDGFNRITVALSDVKTPIKIYSGVVKETADIEKTDELFSQKPEIMEEYYIELWIDMRLLPWQNIINDIKSKWLQAYNYFPKTISDAAYDPVYSTWYSFHKKINTERIIEDLKKAVKLGIKNIIIDDGWQTDDIGFGCSYCGIWKPALSKIPDMGAFVNEVHKLGMRIIIWIAVPYIGKNTTVWKRFSDRYLNGTRGDCASLDPRYPEVRQYLIQSLTYAVQEWNIDGFKLDFIDAFQLTDQSYDAEPDMDTLSLEDGVCMLLDEAYNSLHTIKKDILIEFRQGYIGPIMMRYGDMLRANDCPMDAVTNRIRILNLRITAEYNVVHSDMLMWNSEDTAEEAARQIINVLFAVPQISVYILEIPEQHYRMLKFYLRLWLEHKEIFMKGKLVLQKPEANYSLAYACLKEKVVAVAYSEKLLLIENSVNEIVFINGTGENILYIDYICGLVCFSYKIHNCTGTCIEEGKKIIGNGPERFKIPNSGAIFMKRIE